MILVSALLMVKLATESAPEPAKKFWFSGG